MCVLDVEHEVADLHHGEAGMHSKISGTDNLAGEADALALSISAPPKKQPSSKPSIGKVDLPFQVTAPPKKSKKPTVNKRDIAPMLVTLPPKKKSIEGVPSSVQLDAARKSNVIEFSRKAVSMPETDASPSDRENEPLLAENIEDASDIVSMSTDNNGSVLAEGTPGASGLDTVVASTKSKKLGMNGAGATASNRKAKVSQANKITGKNKAKGKRGKGKGKTAITGRQIASSKFDSNRRGGVRRRSSANTAAQNAKMVKAMAMEKFQGRRTGGHGITISEYKSLLQGPLAAAMGLKPKKKKKKKPKKKKVSKMQQRKQAAKLSAGGVSDAGLKAKEITRRKTTLATERTAENLAKIKKHQVIS